MSKWHLSRAEAEFLAGAIKKPGAAATLVKSLKRKGLMNGHVGRTQLTILGQLIAAGIVALQRSSVMFESLVEINGQAYDVLPAVRDEIDRLRKQVAELRQVLGDLNAVYGDGCDGSCRDDKKKCACCRARVALDKTEETKP